MIQFQFSIRKHINWAGRNLTIYITFCLSKSIKLCFGERMQAFMHAITHNCSLHGIAIFKASLSRLNLLVQ